MLLGQQKFLPSLALFSSDWEFSGTSTLVCSRARRRWKVGASACRHQIRHAPFLRLLFPSLGVYWRYPSPGVGRVVFFFYFFTVFAPLHGDDGRIDGRSISRGDFNLGSPSHWRMPVCCVLWSHRNATALLKRVKCISFPMRFRKTLDAEKKREELITLILFPLLCTLATAALGVGLCSFVIQRLPESCFILRLFINWSAFLSGFPLSLQLHTVACTTGQSYFVDIWKYTEQVVKRQPVCTCFLDDSDSEVPDFLVLPATSTQVQKRKLIFVLCGVDFFGFVAWRWVGFVEGKRDETRRWHQNLWIKFIFCPNSISKFLRSTWVSLKSTFPSCR